MPDYRAMCAELVDDLELCDWPYKLKDTIRADIERARALLAEPDGPAVPEGREPASVATQPSDEELLKKGPSLEEVTDFRALCVELTDCLEKADWPHRYKVVFQQWVDIAHAALAEPEGEEPTDEEVEVWADQQGFIRGHGDHPCGFWIDDGDAGAFARAVLARFGGQR